MRIIRQRVVAGVVGSAIGAVLALAIENHALAQPPREPSRPPGATVPATRLPDLKKITFSPADAESVVTITGDAGAVPASSTVNVLSLQTGARTQAAADERGAFEVRLPAPNGSTLVINSVQGPGRNWLEGSPALEITINPGQLRVDTGIFFTTAGGLGSGYWIADGMLHNSRSQPGESINFTLSFSTAAAIKLPDPPPLPQMSLVRISDPSGAAVQASFTPTLMTPTGLPIFSRDGYEHHGLPFESRLLDADRDKLTVAFSKRIPQDLPAGYYVGRIQWQLPNREPSMPPNGRDEFAHGATAQNFTPVFRIGNPEPPRLPWVLLGNTLSNGTRGGVAREDKGRFDFGTKVTFNAEKLIVPKDDPVTRAPRKYRLEPFLPTLGYIMGGPDRPVPPLVSFVFPSGELHVEVARPDGTTDDLGRQPFRSARCKAPRESSFGPTSLNAVYELTTLDSAFEYEFPRYGHYVVRMEGWIEDAVGNKYHGGGSYDVYVAKSLDLDLGTFLGTPFQVGDEMSPVVHVRPMLPADVEVDFKLCPNSDREQMIRRKLTGRANDFGYFHPGLQAEKLSLSAPGEYVVDVTASYTDAAGVLWMGAARGASVVETPHPKLVAHGKRGLAIPGNVSASRPAWFTARNIDPEGSEERRGTLPQVYYPYFSGDVLWATDGIASGIMPAISVHDPEQLTKLRRFTSRSQDADRAAGEIEVAFPSIGPNRLPAVQFPELIKTWAYYYISVQRPGVTARAFVAFGEVQRAYWQFDDAYNDQLGNGNQGDLPDDVKLQYGGIVYRDVESGVNQYAIYGSMAVMIPRGTKQGMRTFPPFQGAAGGPNGGPLLTLKGQEIDLFFTPVGVMPGTVLEVGDTFSFSGAVWPTLPSLVEATVTLPSGKKLFTKSRANKIGHFHDPSSAFVVTEPGVYTVHIAVTHDGTTSAGPVETPYPTGSVLGAEEGSYAFYVVPKTSASLLTIDTPAEGARLEGNSPPQQPQPPPQRGGEFPALRPGSNGPPPRSDGRPFAIRGTIPAGWTDVTVHFTTNLTGTVLESGTLPIEQGGFTYRYDLRKLHQTFANLDPDPSDTVVVTLAVVGKDGHGQRTAAARQVLFQRRDVLALTVR